MRTPKVKAKMTLNPIQAVLLTSVLRSLQLLAFVLAYIALDWASFLLPLHGLNITLWNPALALGLVVWLRFGPIVTIPWFVALVVGDEIIRGLPASIGMTLLLSATLVIGYGLIAETLRKHLHDADLFGDRKRLITWLGIVVVGTLLNSAIYIILLSYGELLPAEDRISGFVRFWVGDCVGIVVTMPMFWMLLTRLGQERLRKVLASGETAGYALLAVAMLLATFRTGATAEFQYFYFLFLPVVWAAARQGLSGAATSAFILQAGIIIAVDWLDIVVVTAMEFQMLGAVLALVGFFIGVVVDEQRVVAEKLKMSLRLAAAGEMAAALAHELNQPMTALAAYGDTCELLLSRGDKGKVLSNAIRGMISESNRATEVVRRVRDFFRTGATRLESFQIGELIAMAANRFAARAEAEGVELHLPVSEKTVLADKLQIELVLRNLLSNAFDAISGAKPGDRRIDISVLTDTNNEMITVTVEDTGPGLSRTAIDSLFEPFSSTKSSGLGLGLVISRALVEANGGSLWAEARDSGVFRFSLPTNDKEGS